MTPISSSNLLFQDGNQLRRITIEVLAEEFGVPQEQLLQRMREAAGGSRGQVVDGTSKFTGEGALGESARDVRTNVHVNDKSTERERYRAPSEEGQRSDLQSLADYLATQLGDHANIAALRVLVGRYPRSLLAEALRRTQAIPEDKIRKSRGAAFTAIVRILAREG